MLHCLIFNNYLINITTRVHHKCKIRIRLDYYQINVEKANNQSIYSLDNTIEWINLCYVGIWFEGEFFRRIQPVGGGAGMVNSYYVGFTSGSSTWINGCVTTNNSIVPRKILKLRLSLWNEG